MDITYLLFLQKFREATNDIFSPFFEFITVFGETKLSCLFLLIIYWCVSKEVGRNALWGMGFGKILNGFLKLTFCVYRPWVRSELIHPYGNAMKSATGYSFPSGHSTQAVASYGYVGVHYRRKKKVFAVLIAITVCVLFSRNYLGVHTPQDVVVAAVVTAICVYIGIKVQEWIEAGEKENSNRDLIVAAVVTAISIAVIAYILLKSYPIDYNMKGKIIVKPKKMIPDTFKAVGAVLGITYGLILERRFVGFKDTASVKNKIIRFIIGAVVVIGLFEGLNPLLKPYIDNKNVLKMVINFIPMFYGTLIHPWFIHRLEMNGVLQDK